MTDLRSIHNLITFSIPPVQIMLCPLPVIVEPPVKIKIFLMNKVNNRTEWVCHTLETLKLQKVKKQFENITIMDMESLLRR